MAIKKRHQNQNTENGKTNGVNRTEDRRGRHSRKVDKYDKKGTSSSTSLNYKYFALVGVLAFIASFLHGQHLSHMFESDKHFSHLSTLERELAFRTEMGLYFSYYKIMIESPTFFDGLSSIMNDNMTEYPSTINTLKRFNLYPEVVLAIGYRAYTGFMKYLNKPTTLCWTVTRGQGMQPVQSCEGLGEPSYFYVDAVILLNALMMGIFFLFGTFLSGSVFGGIITVAAWFYNHGEATRVQWTPPLRESFAYPFLVIQMFLVTYVIRISHPTYKHSLLIALATICYMLPWQFAQFSLLTQTIAVLGCYVLKYIDSHKARVIFAGQTIGLFVSYIFLFGNEMLLTSFFASSLIIVHIIIALEPVLEHIRVRPAIIAVQGLVLMLGTLGIKLILSKILHIQDDAHISDILRSKFGTFKNFHTMLYTCAKEFDLMEAETPVRLLKTLLLPTVLFVMITVVCNFVVKEYKSWLNMETEAKSSGAGEPKPKDNKTDHPISKDVVGKPNAEVLYHVFQLIAFTVMAVIIMRLKLFLTPQMALFASLIASRQFFSWLGPKSRHYAIVAAILAAMSIGGYFNIKMELSITGEFSNWPMEQMVEWIKANTHKDAVFCGPMPTMATVKLSANRPIVNHPHYEDAGLRARTKEVYSMYSRKSLAEIKEKLVKLRVNYAVVEQSWCIRKTREGCGMPEIWDIEDPSNRGKMPACEILQGQNVGPHFRRVFKNDVYDILEVIV